MSNMKKSNDIKTAGFASFDQFLNQYPEVLKNIENGMKMMVVEPPAPLNLSQALAARRSGLKNTENQPIVGQPKIKL